MPTRKTLMILAFPVILGGLIWAYSQQSSAAGTLTQQDYIDIQQNYSR